MFTLTKQNCLQDSSDFFPLNLELRVKNRELSFQQIWIIPRSNYRQCEFSRETVRTEQLRISDPDGELKDFFVQN